MKFFGALLLSLAIVPATACKQGEGERCQDSVDCADGLECNMGTQLCQEPGGGGVTFDAAPQVVVDAAPTPDAEVVDAAVSEPDADLPDSGPE